MPEEPKGSEAVSPSAGGQPPAEKAAIPTGSSSEKANTAAKPANPMAAKPAEAAAVEPTAPKSSTPDAAKPVDGAAKPAAAKPAPKQEGPRALPWESDLVARLRAQYGLGLGEASTYLGQNYVVVDSSIIYEILLKMRDDEQFDYCVDITAVHYPKRERPFDIVYVLYSFSRNERVRVKTLINEGERLRSAVGIWETANWLEREVFDMFGIEFEGHPDLKRILLPDGWKGHPLRKDYPILQQDKEWVQINLGIESGQ
jgi:NADH-quinone oxidoreductase subunit C